MQAVRPEVHLFAQKPKAEQVAALQSALTVLEKLFVSLCGCLDTDQNCSLPSVSSRFLPQFKEKKKPKKQKPHTLASIGGHITTLESVSIYTKF